MSHFPLLSTIMKHSFENITAVLHLTKQVHENLDHNFEVAVINIFLRMSKSIIKIILYNIINRKLAIFVVD